MNRTQCGFSRNMPVREGRTGLEFLPTFWEGTREYRFRNVAGLLKDLAKGGERAASKFIPFAYSELRRLAGNYMRCEREDHTLQATALVHEEYLTLGI